MENNTQTVLTLPSVIARQQTRTNEWRDAIEEAIIIDEPKKQRSPFIESNTTEVTLQHLREECIIPVFSKDNEVCISQPDFIETIHEAARDFFTGQQIEEPVLRVSHIIKGRIPEAIHKPVKDLLDSDKTMYYSRMIFNLTIPTIYEDVCGNRLELSISGIKSYDLENLSGKRGAQRFSLAIGFKNLVCTNMCVSTDGYKDEIRATSTADLYRAALDLFDHYNVRKHIRIMQSLQNTTLSEKQFCQILGRMRLYNYLPIHEKRALPKLEITDSQINNVAKQFLHDENFAMTGGEINMWRFYNLLTGSLKSCYIDSFLNRNVNATDVALGLSEALENKDSAYSWFIN